MGASTLDERHAPADAPGVAGALGRHVYRSLPGGERTATIVRRLRDSIAIGMIRIGERLPSEADMADSFGVSPATLREALSQLRDAGLVETRRGRNGGTFVVKTPALSRAEVEERLDAYSVVELRDIGDQRWAISGACARLAAARRNERDAERLRRLADALVAAPTHGDSSRAYTRFWLELAVAAQSRRLLALEIAVQLEVGELLWMPLAAPLDGAAVAESLRGVAEAVDAGDESTASARVAERIRQDVFHLIDEKLTIALAGGEPDDHHNLG